LAYLGTGEITVALDEARIALEADSSYAPAYNLLGLTHMQMKEFPRAEEYFDQALRLAPGDPEIGNNMGWFLCQTERVARSFEYFDSAAKNPLNTTPTQPLLNAGVCAGRIKDYKRAEGYLAQVLRLAPNSTNAMYLMALMLYQQDRLAEARLRLNDLHRRMEPTSGSVWLGLRIERKAGDHEAEQQWITQLRRKFPNSSEYKLLAKGQFE
jgi:type IV pilus assembly protein PilF